MVGARGGARGRGRVRRLRSGLESRALLYALRYGTIEHSLALLQRTSYFTLIP